MKRNKTEHSPTAASDGLPALPRVADLLTPEEVAEALGVTIKTLTNWRSRSTGPVYVRVAGRVFYTRAAYVSYWREQTGEAA